MFIKKQVMIGVWDGKWFAGLQTEEIIVWYELSEKCREWIDSYVIEKGVFPPDTEFPEEFWMEMSDPDDLALVQK